MNKPIPRIQDQPPGEPSPPRMPNPAHGQIPGAQMLSWSARNAQIMFELHQALFGIGLDLMQRQQEAVATAMRKSLFAARDQSAAANDDGFAGFARLGMEAFEQMAAAMQLVNDRTRTVANEPPAAEPRQGG